MKKIIAIALLSILATRLGMQSLAAPSNRLETFADWCQERENLTPEARHTVEVVLEKVGTTECDRAEEKVATWSALAAIDKQIVDVAPFASLTNLTHLDLSNNQIVEVEPLAHLTNLTELVEFWLGNNQIEDIAPLARLTHLTNLDLSNNQIEDIVPLARLTHLQGLMLRNNKIGDISPLASLTALDILDLRGNPLRDRVCPVQPETICQF